MFDHPIWKRGPMLDWAKLWTYVKPKPKDGLTRNRGFAIIATDKGFRAQMEEEPVTLLIETGADLFVGTLGYPPAALFDQVISNLNRDRFFHGEGKRELRELKELKGRTETEDLAKREIEITSMLGEQMLKTRLAGQRLDLVVFAAQWSPENNRQITFAMVQLEEAERVAGHGFLAKAGQCATASREKEQGLSEFVKELSPAWHALTSHTVNAAGCLALAVEAEEFRRGIEWPSVLNEREKASSLE